MRRFFAGAAAAAMVLCSLMGTASAHGGHHRAVRQCDSSTCTVNGVCDGTCDGTGLCRNYDGCNYAGNAVYSSHHRRGCHR